MKRQIVEGISNEGEGMSDDAVAHYRPVTVRTLSVLVPCRHVVVKVVEGRGYFVGRAHVLDDNVAVLMPVVDIRPIDTSHSSSTFLGGGPLPVPGGAGHAVAAGAVQLVTVETKSTCRFGGEGADVECTTDDRARRAGPHRRQPVVSTGSIRAASKAMFNRASPARIVLSRPQVRSEIGGGGRDVPLRRVFADTPAGWNLAHR
jgi:hypothetical protein